MSIVHDHTLLTDFAAYIYALGGEDTSASITVHIDDYLATRRPPGEPAINLTCPYCNRSYCNGECEPGMRTPPAPQRFWRVVKPKHDCYAAAEVNHRGETQRLLSVSWAKFDGPEEEKQARRCAENDGIKSGLEPWTPGAKETP